MIDTKLMILIDKVPSFRRASHQRQPNKLFKHLAALILV